MLNVGTEFRKGILFVRLKGHLNKDKHECKDNDVLEKMNQIQLIQNSQKRTKQRNR